MKSWCTTNRRDQIPLSNMWELEINGKRTGKIYKNADESTKCYSWGDIRKLTNTQEGKTLSQFTDEELLHEVQLRFKGANKQADENTFDVFIATWDWPFADEGTQDSQEFTSKSAALKYEQTLKKSYPVYADRITNFKVFKQRRFPMEDA